MNTLPPTQWPAVLAGCVGFALAACAEPELPVVAPPLGEVLELVEVIDLEEEREPRFPNGNIIYPTGGLDEFVERRDGSLVIADRFQPRVRAFAADGSWLASFGRYGDGPWDLKFVGGLAETASAKVVVVGRDLWLTQLNADLTPDTLLPTYGVRARNVWAAGDEFVLHGGDYQGSAGKPPPRIHRLSDGKVAWSSWPSPRHGKPYKGDMAHSGGVAGDSIYTMDPEIYPLTVLNGAGDSIGAIGQPPPWFRDAPDIPYGAFAFRMGESPDYSALPRYFEHHDLVHRVDVVAGDHLIFTLGQQELVTPTSLRAFHTSIEVYNRHTGQKLVESVPLPEGVRVLGGGRFLYVLMDRDLPPWRIAKYRLIVGRAGG